MKINHGLACSDRERYLLLVGDHPEKRVVFVPDIESAWRYAGLSFRSMKFEDDVRDYLNCLVRWVNL